MYGIARTLIGCTLLLMVGPGCPAGGTGSGGGSGGTGARAVQVFNCTRDDGINDAQPGRSYRIWTKLEGSEWEDRGSLNHNNNWTECHIDGQPQPPSLTVNLLDAPSGGKWQIWAMQLPPLGESCDSSPLDAPESESDKDAVLDCASTVRHVHTDVTASQKPVPFYLTQPGDG